MHAPTHCGYPQVGRNQLSLHQVWTEASCRPPSMASRRPSSASAVTPQYTPLSRKCSVAKYSKVSACCTRVSHALKTHEIWCTGAHYGAITIISATCLKCCVASRGCVCTFAKPTMKSTCLSTISFERSPRSAGSGRCASMLSAMCDTSTACSSQTRSCHHYMPNSCQA